MEKRCERCLAMEQTVDRLIGELTKLVGEITLLRGLLAGNELADERVRDLEELVGRLRERLAQMEAPVSQKEWHDSYSPQWRSQEGQDRCYAVILARAARAGGGMAGGRRLVISHLQGESDVVELGGGKPNRFVKSFEDDVAAQTFIDAVEGGKAGGE